MCFRETKRYVYEKDLFYLHETKNYVYLVVLNKAQKNKETLSLFFRVGLPVIMVTTSLATSVGFIRWYSSSAKICRTYRAISSDVTSV